MTALESFAQPFVRYRTGDVVRMSGDRCRDGRSLPVIGEVLGRTTDFIVRADGAIMHALAVIYVLRAVSGVGEFKIVQHALGDIEVQVVPDASWEEGARLAIEAGLRERLGADSRIDVRLVEEIPPESSGKHRYVISHVPLEGGLKLAGHGPTN